MSLFLQCSPPTSPTGEPYFGPHFMEDFFHERPSTPHYHLGSDPSATESDDVRRDVTAADEQRMIDDLDLLHGCYFSAPCASCGKESNSVTPDCDSGVMVCLSCALAAERHASQRIRHRIPPKPRVPTPPPAVFKPDAKTISTFERRRRRVPEALLSPPPIRASIPTPPKREVPGPALLPSEVYIQRAVALASLMLPPPPPQPPKVKETSSKPAPPPSLVEIPKGGKVPRKRKWVGDMPLGSISVVYSVNGGSDQTYDHPHVATSESYDAMMNKLIDHLMYVKHEASEPPKIRITSAVLTIGKFVLRQI